MNLVWLQVLPGGRRQAGEDPGRLQQRRPPQRLPQKGADRGADPAGPAAPGAEEGGHGRYHPPVHDPSQTKLLSLKVKNKFFVIFTSFVFWSAVECM